MLICVASQGSVTRTVLACFSIQCLRSAALDLLPLHFSSMWKSWLLLQLLAESTQIAEEFMSGMQTSRLVNGDASFDWITTVKIVLFERQQPARLATPWFTSLCLWTDLAIAGRWKNVGQAEVEIAIEICPLSWRSWQYKLMVYFSLLFHGFLANKILTSKDKTKTNNCTEYQFGHNCKKAIPFFKSVACGVWGMSPETFETNQNLGHRARRERERKFSMKLDGYSGSRARDLHGQEKTRME